MDLTCTVERGYHVVVVPHDACRLYWEADAPIQFQASGFTKPAMTGIRDVRGGDVIRLYAGQETKLRFRWRLGRGNHHERR